MRPAVVRPARVADAAAISQLRVGTWRAAYTGMIEADVLDNLHADEATIERQRSHLGDPAPRTHTYVATDGERVVGWVVAGPSRDGDAGEETGEIYSIYVDPAYWSTGIGRDLMATGLRALRTEGFGRVTLWVLQANARARRFYAAAGLAWDGSRKLLDIGGEVPEVRYAAGL